MMIDVEKAKQEIRAAVQELTATRSRLAAVQQDLPRSPQEITDDDLDDDPDVSTEIRSVIGNGLLNCLDPLIRDLLDAAVYEPALRKYAGGRDGE
jgi:SMC interacting uncharacterized protein involved in chromosome segregation